MIAIQPIRVKAELLQCDLKTVVSSDLQNCFGCLYLAELRLDFSAEGCQCGEQIELIRRHGVEKQTCTDYGACYYSVVVVFTLEEQPENTDRWRG